MQNPSQRFSFISSSHINEIELSTTPVFFYRGVTTLPVLTIVLTQLVYVTDVFESYTV